MPAQIKLGMESSEIKKATEDVKGLNDQLGWTAEAIAKSDANLKQYASTVQATKVVTDESYAVRRAQANELLAAAQVENDTISANLAQEQRELMEWLARKKATQDEAAALNKALLNDQAKDGMAYFSNMAAQEKEANAIHSAMLKEQAAENKAYWSQLAIQEKAANSQHLSMIKLQEAEEKAKAAELIASEKAYFAQMEADELKHQVLLAEQGAIGLDVYKMQMKEKVLAEEQAAAAFFEMVQLQKAEEAGLVPVIQ